MELKILTQEEKTQYRGAILALREESDNDFFTLVCDFVEKI